MRDQEIVDLWEAYASIYTEQSVEEEVIDEDAQKMVGQALDAAANNPVIKAIGSVIKPVGQGRKTPTKDGNWRPIVAKEEVEEVDEAMSSYDRNRKRAAQRAEARNEARRRGQTGNVPGVGYVSPRPERSTYRDESGVERHHTGARMPKKEDQKESVDLFDTILEYLVAEGYADTNKAALAIMANMSEEWKQDIVEGMDMKAFKERRRKLQHQAASDDAKKRGHVDKFTGKPYGTAEAASRRKDIHKPEKAPEREARRKFAEDPN